MDEILEQLPAGSLVLDLGSREGSFSDQATPARAILVDLVAAQSKPRLFVQADAARLPFRSRTFDAIILNHSVEHFVRLKPCLQELGRVVKSGGAAYVAVPDARTLTDRLYRKMFLNSGGHVNLFDSARKLEKSLSWYLGLPHVATRTLLSSFTFLNRRNYVDAISRSQTMFAGLWEPLVHLLIAGTRLIDRWLGTRSSVYGWAFYFGSMPGPIDTSVLVNVCVRCGQAHSAEELAGSRVARKAGLLSVYECPACGAQNLLMRKLCASWTS